MKKLIFICLLFAINSNAQDAASYTKMHIRNVLVDFKSGESKKGNDIDLLLIDKENNKDNILYNDPKLNIIAKYKIQSYNSKRSSTKSTGVKVTITYYSNYGEEKDKRTFEKVFYLDQDRKIDVKEVFVYKNGLQPITLTLTYQIQFD
jgi:hypothetical protein